MAPGDPVDLILGDEPQFISTEAREKIRHDLGLDASSSVEWARFVKRACVLDFGNSLSTQRSVRALIAERLPNTLILALAASLLANLAGLILGAMAALRPRGWASAALFWFSSLFQSMPSFWIGPLLIIAFALHWPGLGTLMYDAISQRDYPTVQGVVLIIAVGYVALNLMADLIAARFSLDNQP